MKQTREELKMRLDDAEQIVLLAGPLSAFICNGGCPEADSIRALLIADMAEVLNVKVKKYTENRDETNTY